MYPDNRNIYKTARLSAGLTQETAAELLDLSVETVRAYETGARLPPAGTVCDMAEIYHSPALRLRHARANDELGIIPDGAEPRPLPQIVLSLWNRSRDIPLWLDRLMEIAEDGVVDETEEIDLSQIQRAVGQFVSICLDFEFCDEGTKKERPDVGASKRSGSRSVGTTENYCKTIIPAYPAERKQKFCAGKAVTST